MVESIARLDTVFQSLADPTRRDILARVMDRELSVGEIAERYAMSLAAVSKHLQVLERAGLVSKRRLGKERIVTIEAAALHEASLFLDRYARLWEERLDRLGEYLANDTTTEGDRS